MSEPADKDLPAFFRPGYWEQRGYGLGQRLPCKRCGAPGQRAGESCEYCKVVVSP